MTYARTLIQDFSTANPIYVNGIVTFYRVANGEKTNVKANLYSAISGVGKLSNPQKLDSYGKFKNPVYIDQPVIMTVEGVGSTPDHETGVVVPATIIMGTGAPNGVVTGSRGNIYLRTDGGAGSTFYVKETGDNTNTGWSAK